MRNRQGCLAGLLELFFLDRAFGWLERRFGFGRGCSCSGCGLRLHHADRIHGHRSFHIYSYQLDFVRF